MLFFGAARDAVGQGEVDLPLPAGQTAAGAFALVQEKFPGLSRFGRSLLFAVNQEYAGFESGRELHDGDELAVFPPVSGGSSMENKKTNSETELGKTGTGGVSPAATRVTDFFELTEAPIDVGAVARRVVLPECGATVTLDGYAREWTRGRQTLYLVYEAYAPWR